MKKSTSASARPATNGRILTVAQLAEAKRLPLDFLVGLGLKDTPRGVGIPYADAAGNPMFIRERLALEKTAGGDERFRQPKGVPTATYGLDRLYDAGKAGFLILVEGESDCWALWHHDFPALGLPGSNTARCLEKEILEAIGTLYIHKEPDQGGESFVAGVRAQLKELGWQGKAYELTMPVGVKDPADLHVLDADALEGTLKARMRAAAVSGSKRPAKAKHSPEPYRPFPVDALPQPLAIFVAEGAAAFGCDPAYFALPALAAAASLIGNTRTIRLKRDWHEPSVVWGAVVADSGTTKSPAHKRVISYLYDLEKNRIEEYAGKRSEYEEAKAKYDRERAKQAAGRPAPIRPEEPVCSRHLCSDITVERIAGLLADNPRGLLVGRDELNSWFASFSRYRSGAGGSDLPQWLEMFRAETLIVDRKTGDRQTIYVPRAAVSITGTIPPGTLRRALTEEHLEAGLGARLLLAMPPKLPKKWTELEIHPDTQRGYERLVDALLSLQFAEGSETPIALPMTAEAKDRWVKFYNQWAQHQADAEGVLASCFSKLEAYAARFALIHHVVSRAVDGTDRSPIEPVSIDAACKLVHWFACEAQRIYSALAESDDDRQTRRLIDFIRCKGGRITARQLQNSNSRRYPNAEAADGALEDLVKLGVGKWLHQPATARGGHPTRVLSLNSVPTPDTTDRTPEDEYGDETSGPTEPSDTIAVASSFPVENGGSVGSVGCRLSSSGQPEANGRTKGLRQAEEVVSAPDDTKQIFPPDPPKRKKP